MKHERKERHGEIDYDLKMELKQHNDYCNKLILKMVTYCFLFVGDTMIHCRFLNHVIFMNSGPCDSKIYNF